MNQLRGYWRHGAWLGLSWGAVEWAAQGWYATPAWSLVLAELLLSTVVWTLIALILGRVLVGSEASFPRFRAALLGAFFFCGANLLVHPYLLAGVRILTPQGALFSLAMAAVFLPLPALLQRYRPLRSRLLSSAPAAWCVPALLLGAGFVLGRQHLAGWPAGWGRVLAGIGLLMGLQAVSLLAFAIPRRAVTALAAGLIILLLLPVRPWVRAQAEPTHVATAPPTATSVLLVSLDTTRWDHVSAFGYPRPTTPHLDRFLKEALVFPRAYATSSWTLPSHASVFTGLYPLTHGADFRPGAAVGEPPQWLVAEAPTLAERFRDRGYLTAAISANRIAVTPDLGLDRGFQVVHADVRAPNRPIPATLMRSAGRLISWPWLKRLTREHWDGDQTTRYALDWLEENAERPFLLFVNYMDPHSPYAPPLPLSLAADESRFLERLRWQFSGNRSPRQKIDAYDGEIRHMDNAFGRLLAGMEQLGIHDRTLIVVFSDHGELLGEFGMWGHNRDVHEALLRAILAVRYPGGARAGTDSTLVNLADVPALIGVTEAGRPDIPDFGDRNRPWIAGEKNLTASDMKRSRRWRTSARLVAARLDRYKLIQAPESSVLFDVRTDPGETEDLSARLPEVAEELRRFVRHWHEVTPVARHAGREEAGEATRDLLRSLGYMQ